MREQGPIVSVSDQLYALLAVIADPAAHKTRLDELVEKEKAASARIAELNDMQAETRRLHSTAQATNIVSDNRKQALDAKQAELDERARTLAIEADNLRARAAQSAAKLQARETELASREAFVASMKKQVEAMQAETKAALDQAETMKARLQRQMAAVKVAIDG